MNIKSELENRVEITIEYLETMIKHREEYMHDLEKIAAHQFGSATLKNNIGYRVEQIKQEIVNMKFTIKSLKGEF